ncbi:MAG: hypothetical protein HY765_02515 [Rhodomicrobium sp.]|nr:hypothetical protein [Rhodomicrobium sp.]
MKNRITISAGFAIVYSILLFFCTPAAAADCTPSINVEPMSAGEARLEIAAPCLPGRKVRLHYDALELVRTLDENGRLTMLFDCFLGEKIPLTADFQDGPTVPVQLRTLDLERITMVAVSWKASVNLDLHAFEYASGLSDDNHVWQGAPSSRWKAEERKRQDNRGHGFIGFTGDGTSEGDQLEVYTFVHEPNQTSGAVTLALDYESRARRKQDPDACGTGLYADLEYKVFVWHPNGRITRSRGLFAPLECNQPADQLARYSSKALPQLILTR